MNGPAGGKLPSGLRRFAALLWIGGGLTCRTQIGNHLPFQRVFGRFTPELLGALTVDGRDGPVRPAGDRPGPVLPGRGARPNAARRTIRTKRSPAPAGELQAHPPLPFRPGPPRRAARVGLGGTFAPLPGGVPRHPPSAAGFPPHRRRAARRPRRPRGGRGAASRSARSAPPSSAGRSRGWPPSSSARGRRSSSCWPPRRGTCSRRRIRPTRAASAGPGGRWCSTPARSPAPAAPAVA